MRKISIRKFGVIFLEVINNVLVFYLIQLNQFDTMFPIDSGKGNLKLGLNFGNAPLKSSRLVKEEPSLFQ